LNLNYKKSSFHIDFKKLRCTPQTCWNDIFNISFKPPYWNGIKNDILNDIQMSFQQPFCTSGSLNEAQLIIAQSWKNLPLWDPSTRDATKHEDFEFFEAENEN